MLYTWQLALVLVPVYFIKHLVSCYIYYIHPQATDITCSTWLYVVHLLISDLVG